MTVLHLVNRLLAVLVSLAVLSVAVVVGVEVTRWALDLDRWVVPWRDWGTTLSTLRADDQSLIVVSAVTAGVGLLLVWFELHRRRPAALATRPLLYGVPTVVTRAGVRSAATTAARGVSGVGEARATLRRRGLRVRVRTRARGEAGGLADQVTAAVTQSLEGLEFVQRPRVKVDVRETS